MDPSAIKRAWVHRTGLIDADIGTLEAKVQSESSLPGGNIMQPQNEVGLTSRAKLWTGRVITLLTVAFLLFDAMVKVLNLPVAVEGTVRLGYPAGLVMYIGIAELICLALYLYPRTAVLGAILLTGYLGGATATQVRVGDPWFIFPVVVGVLVWAGLFLRTVRLGSLLPLQSGVMKAPALVRIGA